MGLIYFDKFIKARKRTDFVITFLSFFILNMLYFGRALGLFPLLFSLVLLFLIKIKPKYTIRYFLSLIFGIPILIILMNYASALIGDLNFNFNNFYIYLKEYKLFLGSIGNLIRVPFFRLYESGSLAVNDQISLNSGLLLIVATIIFLIVYLIKKTRWLFLVNMSLFWISYFYFFNWMWGGGGVYTMVGSTHRYITLSAVGYLFFIILILLKLPKNIRELLMIILIIAFTKYSLYVIDIENDLRNKAKVEPIYQKISGAIPENVETPFILIDTPNELKSFVVGGWFPHTYGFYRGITSSSKLPTVFSFKADAVRWFCEEDSLKRKEIALSSGSADYSGKYFRENEIFAWHLEENGKLSDQRGSFLSDIRKCID